MRCRRFIDGLDAGYHATAQHDGPDYEFAQGFVVLGTGDAVEFADWPGGDDPELREAVRSLNKRIQELPEINDVREIIRRRMLARN